MAKCPACGKHLHVWNIKPECPSCGEDIPNYKFEERLERDAEIAAFHRGRMNVRTAAFKSALFGSKLRIARDVCIFLPLLYVVVPLCNVTAGGFFESGNMSMLDIVLALVKKEIAFSAFTDALSGGKEEMLFVLSIAAAFLSIVFGVLNFFVVILSALKYMWKPNVVLCALSVVCVAVNAALFSAAAGAGATLSGSVSPFIAVGFATFLLNVVMNILVSKGYKADMAEMMSNPYITANKKDYE